MRENNGTTVRSKSKGTNKGPAALPRNDFLKLELKKKNKREREQEEEEKEDDDDEEKEEEEEEMEGVIVWPGTRFTMRCRVL